MKKSLKNYKTFVKENLNIQNNDDDNDDDQELSDYGDKIDLDTKSTDFPEEVLKSVEKILQMNFAEVKKPIINGDEITFGINESDGRLEPENILELAATPDGSRGLLGFGAMKKRKYTVTLILVNNNKEEYKLTYKILYDLNKMSNKRPTKLKEIEFDEEDLTPEEIELKKIEKKSKIKNLDLDDVFSPTYDFPD